MKKILLVIFSLAFLSAIFFGIGIGIAEIVLRISATKQETSSPTPISKTQEQKEEKPAEKPAEQLFPSQEELIEEETKEIVVVSEAPKIEPVTFSFAIIGDTQYYKPGKYGGYLKAIKKISALNPDLVFSIGDRVSSCDSVDECINKLQAWKEALGKLASKIYPVQGNHDRTGKEKADNAWQQAFNLPTNGPAGFSELTYSLDFKNSHFVVLDSEKPSEHLVNGNQRAWLEQDLTKNKLVNTFLFFHEPAYPVSSKIDESLDVNSGERNALWEIITRHKVTAVFVGHEHIHSRRKINGVYQFGFGNTESFNHDMPKAGVAEYAYRGQNFGMVDIKDKQITVKVYTVDGKLLNTIAFEKK